MRSTGRSAKSSRREGLTMSAGNSLKPPAKRGGGYALTLFLPATVFLRPLRVRALVRVR